MKKDCNPKLKKTGYVCNPLTGRWIKADGATAKKLGLSVAKAAKAAAPKSKSPKKTSKSQEEEERIILDTYYDDFQKVPSELASGKYTKEDQDEAEKMLLAIASDLRKTGKAFVALEPTDPLTPLRGYTIMSAYGAMVENPVVAMDGNILLRIFD